MANEEVKKSENKIIEKMTKYIKEGYERNEIMEKIKQDTEEIYEPCIVMNMALHTEIITRFVKSLPKNIQEEVCKYMR